MIFNRRSFIISGASVMLVGGISAESAAFALDRPFILEEFFVGRTVGVGHFSIPLLSLKREMIVRTQGEWNGRVLTLREDFDFEDGEKDHKTWRFTRKAEGRYEGRREDVVGIAEVQQVGRVVRLDYEADVRGQDGTVTRLGFHDTIGYSSSGGVYNIASVTRYGLPIGDVKLGFLRA